MKQSPTAETRSLQNIDTASFLKQLSEDEAAVCPSDSTYPSKPNGDVTPQNQ